MEVTSIAEENIEYFEKLVSGELLNQSDLLMGVINDGAACGVLGVKMTGTAFHINLIYVAEAERRKGAATLLMSTLMMFAPRYGIDEISISFAENGETEAIRGLVNKMMFQRALSEGVIYEAKCEAFCEYFNRKVKCNAELIRFERVLFAQWDEFQKLAMRQEDPVYLNEKSYYDKGASFLVLEAGKCAGGILVSKTKDTYQIEYALVVGKHDPNIIMSLFDAVFEVIKERNHLDQTLLVNAINDVSDKLFQKLSGGKCSEIGKAVTYYYSF